MWKKAGIGLGVVFVALGYLDVHLVLPGQVDVRYCQQLLDVTQETHDLTIAPTPEQAQQLTEAVGGLAALNNGAMSFGGADAAATLMSDLDAVGGSPSAADALRISREIAALA